ncbi:MAG: Crp/Fnr family transcriptional regulator [Chloroflexi bacterium]|nr:Crp/Fnr family transcriptional regulator [Chloroflexota bacterium]
MTSPTTTVTLDFLKQIPYFAALDAEGLESVRSLVREKTFDRGEMVILEGDPGEAIYFIAKGRVKIFKTSSEGKEQILRFIRNGESFNEVPVFDGGPNPASVETMEPTTLYVIRKSDMSKIVRDYPVVATTVIRILANRLRQLVELVEDLSFRHVSSRVAKILLQHAAEVSGTGGFEGKLTQQQMAAMAGTAREMVGRALKALEQQGAIKLERGRIVIVDREALEEMT